MKKKTINQACLQKPHRQTIMRIPNKVYPHVRVTFAKKDPDYSKKIEGTESLLKFLREEEAEIDMKYKNTELNGLMG